MEEQFGEEEAPAGDVVRDYEMVQYLQMQYSVGGESAAGDAECICDKDEGLKTEYPAEGAAYSDRDYEKAGRVMFAGPEIIEEKDRTGKVDAECLWSRPEDEEEEEEEAEEEQDEETLLLEPDHPILEKFQRALREYLVKQIEYMNNEVFELESGAKKKNAEREKMGVEAYEIQQNVNKQREEIELSQQQLENITAAKEQVDLDLKEAIRQYEEEKQKLLEAEKSEIQLRKELESVDLLYHQISTWETQIESDLAVNQRMFEKTRKEKLLKAEEKRQQDAFIYRLMTEIWRLEGEIETMDMQLRVKEEERERLAEKIAIANIDLETFNGEQKCLMDSWNSLLFAIGHRDRIHASLEEELEKRSEKLRSILSEIEQLKKLSTKEMYENERLTVFKERILYEIQNITKKVEIEANKRNKLERQLASTTEIIAQTEKDVARVQAENNAKEYAIKVLLKDLERLDAKKAHLEEEILKRLEDQITNDKAAKHMKKLIREARDKNKDLEISLANTENQNAKMLMEIEHLKYVCEKTQHHLDELLRQQTELEEEIKKYKQESANYDYENMKKRRTVGLLNKKIEALLEKTGGADISPLEMKIRALEGQLEEIQKDIKKLQTFWLREQTFVVNLTQQRQKQMQDLNIMRKQVMLLTQKNLKIGDELDTYKKEENKIDKNMTNMLNRLTVLNEKVNKLRGTKENLDKDTSFKEFEFSGILQDAEMDVLQLENECCEIEEDKVRMSDELIELNREALCWEKKIIMILELKQQIKQEKSEGGEVATMKSEIQRMQVRLGQLKKAQDKLMHDLQHCIFRREAIVNMAEAREKRVKGAVDQTKINFSRKLDNARNKKTQLEAEIEKLEKEIKAVEEEVAKVDKNIVETDCEINQYKERIESIKEDVEAAKTEKQKTLEILLLKQKKLQVYTDVSKELQPYISYVQDKSIAAELEKQKELNTILIGTVQRLFGDFHNRYQHFLRVYNTLCIPIMYL